MATRVYCDHCGCTISGKSPNKFSFGPKIHYDPSYDQMKAQMVYTQAQNQYYLAQSQQLGACGNGTYTTSIGGYGGGGGNMVPHTHTVTMPGAALNMAMPGTRASSSPVVETIDLCDRCVNIWMERVRKLCRASDPNLTDTKSVEA